ncbi:MAG: radical SAM protein [Candidatus Omnitrophota bacterium]|jgi:radical SAM protein with 4Fe4S-binding SPASM domain
MSIDHKRLLYLARRGFLFWLSRKIDYPLVSPDCLQINFTFRCNLRCKMCSMQERMESFRLQNKQIELDKQTIKKLIKEAFAMGVVYLILIGGEPFLDPGIYEIIAYAKQCGMRGVTVVTNGTLFSEPVIKEIFDCKLDNLSISIDAASEAVVSQIRGENVLQKIIDNVTLLNRMKERAQLALPNIVCVCTIMNQNVHEIMDVVALCRKLKIPRIIFQPVVHDNTDQNRIDFSSDVFIPAQKFSVLDGAIDSLIEYKQSNRNNYEFVANSTVHLKLIKKYFRSALKPRELPCYSGFNRIQVVQEGKIYFCVNQSEHEAVVGNMNTDSLKAVWFSKEARDLRKLIRKCVFPCLQWCAYRDEFIEISDIWEKNKLFKNNP